jgi:hypothetical protein
MARNLAQGLLSQDGAHGRDDLGCLAGVEYRAHRQRHVRAGELVGDR